jgi:hypothetical protein
MENSKKLFKKYLTFNRQALKDNPAAKDLFDHIRNGERRYAKVHRTEDSARDISWVDKLNDAIPHLQTIVDNPKSFIKAVEYLVPAELAKKTGPESVTHLATHSQYVKEIDKDGSVIPSKILTTEGDIDVQIYENRFLMTLLKRLNLYVEKRYVYLKRFAALQDMDIFYLDNTYKIGETTFTQHTELTVATPAEASKDIRVQIASSMDKVENIRKYVASFMLSKFMKQDMKGARPVVPPIMQTNMLKANPDYHAAYNLWLFLNEEEHASMDFIVNEELKGLTSEEQRRIDFINYMTALDVLTGAQMRAVRYTKLPYQATVLPSIDDLLFLNDKFMPYELIRADEKYYEDLAAPLEKVIVNKPKTVVKKVFVSEKKRLLELERQKRAALALKKRREAEGKKIQEAMEKERLAAEKAAAVQAAKEAEEAEKRRVSELEQLRINVKDTALADKKNLTSLETEETQPAPVAPAAPVPSEPEAKPDAKPEVKTEAEFEVTKASADDKK